MNNFYFAIVFDFFMKYKTNHCTIREFGELRKKVVNSFEKNYDNVLKNFL